MFCFDLRGMLSHPAVPFAPVTLSLTMNLYNFSIQKPTAISCAICGSFSAPKVQEFVVGRGKVLELLRPTESGKLLSVLAWECFGLIRSIAPFRLPGALRDAVAVDLSSVAAVERARSILVASDPLFRSFSCAHGLSALLWWSCVCVCTCRCKQRLYCRRL